MQATITELWVYPIKGCAGTRLSAVQALPTGLQHDRCMVVVDADTDNFITQRSYAKMALIRPQILGDTLSLSLAGAANLTLDMTTDGTRTPVTVWRDTLPAIDMGDAAAAWFSAALNANLRLMRFDPAQRRAVKREPAHSYLFADGYPYLVLSQASLNALNERLISKGEASVPVDRFRANIIIDGVDAHTEDYAAALTHASGAIVTIDRPCVRCAVPNIDQTTGITNPMHEPSLTLGTYRYDKDADGITFGMNALLTQVCELREGDALGIKLAF